MADGLKIGAGNNFWNKVGAATFGHIATYADGRINGLLEETYKDKVVKETFGNDKAASKLKKYTELGEIPANDVEKIRENILKKQILGSEDKWFLKESEIRGTKNSIKKMAKEADILALKIKDQVDQPNLYDKMIEDFHIQIKEVEEKLEYTDNIDDLFKLCIKAYLIRDHFFLLLKDSKK